MASTINLLRLLADPTRLRLLLLLEQEELSVAELQQILGMGQSRISSHLALLKRAGVVSDRRVGKNVYYGANHQGRNLQRERVAEITRLLARELQETSRDRTSLKLVLHRRQDKARKYFDELAGKFGRSYVPGRSWQALAHTLITLLPPLTVADLGAGEGTLSQLLAKRARKVIAVDNSLKMVEFGSQLAKKHGFKNLEYRLGERAIMTARRILKRGGRLVILDLLSHRFERARELYADHWLGFSEVQLHQFLEKGGFRDIEVSVVSREKQSPHFQTVFATGIK
jgi:DNA-binding transcriptional ArsR family regulator/ubiquinone/menaquinone biosynthesis C-methylase UbiE